MPEKCEVLEELRWSPGVPDCDLMMYLRAARSMAAFAGMCDGGSAEDGCMAASRDDTTINAMDLLHESSYDTAKALQALVKNPIPPGIDKKWVEEEQKRFVKGLRQYGKNFFKIRKELLPHKETADLVEFYYLWKKSPGAVTSRTHRRNRRQSNLRRIKASPAKQNRPSTNDFSKLNVEASSGSDEGEDSEDSDSRDITSNSYTCQNCCTTTSKDWLPVGKDLAVMCTECRLYYKKHGELRPVDTKDNLPFLFQPVKEEDGVNGKHVMRTRRSKEPSSPKTVANENNSSSKAGRKSPGAASNCSTGSVDRDRKKKQNQDSSQKTKRKIKEEKVSPDEAEEDKSTGQKKKIRSESPSESVCTESSVSNEEVIPDGETPSSPSPGASPVPSPRPLLSQLPANVESEPDVSVDPGTTTPTVDMNVTIKEEIVAPVTPEPTICPPVEVKQEIITNDAEENQCNPEPIEQQPVQLEMIEKVKEEVPLTSCTSSAAPSPVPYGPPIEETPPIDECPPPVPEPPQYPTPTPEQPPEEAPIPNTSPYPGPPPQSIKMEPVDIAPSPPPPAIHEPAHHPHVYAPSLPSSSQTHFSNSISIAVTNSSVTGSISASSSISLSYHNHSKMPYSGHSTLITTSQSMSAFNYRPFSPQYPYAPGLPPFPHMPSQPIKHKYNTGTSESPNSHTPPPTSSPYSSAPPALPQPYQDSPPPSKLHSHGDSSSSFPRSTQSNTAAVQSPPITSHSSVPHQPSAHSSSKSPSSYSLQNQNPQSSSSQKGVPQPAHQSSLYPQLGMNQQSSMKSSNHSHQLARPHPLSQMHPSSGLPTSSQHLPPTTYVSNLPPQVPLSQSQMHSSERQESEKCSVIQEPVTIEEEEETETHFPFRGPSPEPRVEDVECHRSQSAIFLRHWNRGEFNSCARTDLTFKPVPDSKLARKREERARKAAEKEREETKARLGSTPDNKPGSSSQNDGRHMSPFERHGVRNGPDTPALRQLSEYARPHAASFPPGYARGPQAGPLGVLSHGIDPLLHYQLSTGMYGAAARERLEMEMEREKRERDLHDKLKAEYEMKARYDPHWIELQRRYGGLQGGPSVGLAPAHVGLNHGPLALYSPADRERLGIPPNVPVSEAAAIDRMNAERAHSERLMLGTDPLLRLQMAGLAPELHTHAHTHAHAHTHLHLHPHDAVSAAAAAAAAMGVPPGMEPGVHPSSGSHPLLPPTGYAAGGPRPGIVPRAELLHPGSGMMRPPYDEQFAHQITAQIAHHEQIQRQLLMERERFAHMGAPMPHPSPLISQHEEFLRQQQQREREIKLRTLEEAARGRPPMN